jgi:hypothetical protein
VAGLRLLYRSEANSLPSLFVAAKATTQIHDGEVLEGEHNQDEIAADNSIPGQQDAKEDKNRGGFILVDGVVIGTTSSTVDSFTEENSSNVQSSYYATLRHRFVHLQRTLRYSHPPAAISNLDQTHPITFLYHIKSARVEWRRVIFRSDPQMVQLACMDMQSVLNVLRLIGDIISECINGGDVTQIRRIGAWAWGLLGRCRDVGELSSEEVCELRYIGRQAVSAVVKLKKLAIKDLEDESMDLGPEDNKPSDEANPLVETTETATLGNSTDEIANTSIPTPTTEPLLPLGETETTDYLEAAKLRLQSRLRESADCEDQELKADLAERRRRNTSSPLGGDDDDDDDDEVLEDGRNQDIEPEDPPQNTPQNRDSQSRALLDMIITVVGEFYGQKDLLLQRDIWQ